MSQKKYLIGAHMSPLQATAVVGTNGYADNLSVAKTLTGSNQAGALQLGADVEVVTGSANTGGLLPPNADPSDEILVYNQHASNTIKIYPATSSGTINGGSAGASVSITALGSTYFTCIGADNWIAK